MATCRWAGWTCTSRVVDTAAHRGLLIEFWQSDFLSLLPEVDEDMGEAVDEEVEAGRLWSLSRAFRDACDVLQPEAAGVWTRPQMDVDRECEEFSLLAINDDTDGLLMQYYGALYLSAELGIGSAELRDERDLLSCRAGQIVYSGSGRDRWF